MFSRVDDTIKEYRMVYTKLKEEVDRDTVVQAQLATARTELVTTRVLGLAETIGTHTHDPFV